jgi:hypothetical protein
LTLACRPRKRIDLEAENGSCGDDEERAKNTKMDTEAQKNGSTGAKKRRSAKRIQQDWESGRRGKA